MSHTWKPANVGASWRDFDGCRYLGPLGSRPTHKSARRGFNGFSRNSPWWSDEKHRGSEPGEPRQLRKPRLNFCACLSRENFCSLSILSTERKEKRARVHGGVLQLEHAGCFHTPLRATRSSDTATASQKDSTPLRESKNRGCSAFTASLYRITGRRK